MVTEHVCHDSKDAQRICRFEQIVRCRALMVGEFWCPGSPKTTGIEAAPHPEIVLARQGAYIRRDSAGTVYIDRTVAAFFEAGRPYVIEHPQRRPDLSTVISLLDPAAVCDALNLPQSDGRCFARSAVRVSPELLLSHRQLQASVRASPRSDLACEEIAVSLVNCAVALNHWSGGDLAWRDAQPLTRNELDIAFAIAEYLNAHFRSRISLETLSAYTGYSLFHICRLFQARMKTTIHKYLTTLRLEAAMEALVETDASITELALDLGFASHSHFTAAFSRWAGIAPSRVRRNQRGASS